MFFSNFAQGKHVLIFVKPDLMSPSRESKLNHCRGQVGTGCICTWGRRWGSGVTAEHVTEGPLLPGLRTRRGFEWVIAMGSHSKVFAIQAICASRVYF